MIELQDYERLRNSILLRNAEKSIKSIMLTSSVKGEGCSTVASNLAALLAKNRELKVCLIDCTSMHPSPQRFLELAIKPAFQDLDLRESPIGTAFKKTTFSNLCVITKRESNKNSPATFDPQRLDTLLELKKEFDFLIYDYAPIATHSHIPFFASQMDGVVLVIHAGKTRREVVQNTKEQLEIVQANILGVVLNRKKHFIPDFLYKRL